MDKGDKVWAKSLGLWHRLFLGLMINVTQGLAQTSMKRTYVVEICGIECVMDEGDKAGGSMIGVEDKDVVVGAALNGSATAHCHLEEIRVS